MHEIEEIFRAIAEVPDCFGYTIDSVDFRNGYGDTPLHIVASWGDCRAITVLIDAGAEINATGETGFTPLHCAAEQNHPDAIRLLLRLGAKILQDENGNTPGELALVLDNKEAFYAFGQTI